MSTTTSPSAAGPTDTLQEGDAERLGFGKLVAWAGAGLSAGANFIVLGYLSLYATDTLGMSPATIGTIIAVGTVANAALGLVAAWIVDRTPETRFGKARPYELAVPLLWVATGVLFAVPGSAGPTLQIAWIGITFLMIKAVFATLLGANDVLYMARAFPSRLVYAKVQTRAGIITSLGSVAVSVALPILLQGAGKDPDAWRMTMGGVAIVLGLLGTTRGLFIKETIRTEVTTTPVPFREILEVLRTNKWVWVIATMWMAFQMSAGANVAGYYYRYIVGNLAIQGLVAMTMIVLLPLLLVVPRLMRRMPVSQIIMGGAALGVTGGVVLLLAGANIPLLIVGGILTGVAALPISYLQMVLVLDLATYNQALGRRRLESILGATVAICGSIGAALAAAIVGAVLSATGYDGSAGAQSGGVELTIRLLFGLSSVVPFLIVLGAMLLFRRFEVRILPTAQRDAAARREAELAAEAEAEFATGADVPVGGPAPGIPATTAEPVIDPRLDPVDRTDDPPSSDPVADSDHPTRPTTEDPR